MQKKKIILLILLILIIVGISALILLKPKKNSPMNLAAGSEYSTKIGETEYDITNAVQEPSEIIPTLSAGMIPIKKNGESWIIADKNDWFDYTAGLPAYIMLNDGYYKSELEQGIAEEQLASNNVGNDALVVPNISNNNPTIYMYIPRYAYNNAGEILYIKQGCSVAGTWTIPEMFTYETEKRDFSLAGLWVEYNPLSSTTEVDSKISNMIGENNKYGFIANTIATNANNDASYKTTIETFIANAVGNDALVVPLNDITNPNRTILKIINTNKLEPIRGTATLNEEELIITINVTYNTNEISKIIDINNRVIGENSNIAEEKLSEDTLGEYIVIDKQGNMKKIETEKIFVIPNVERLVKFRDRVNAGEDFAGVTVYQVADIDMSSACSESLGSWDPIGVNETCFAGTYNGMYHSISNLYINSDEYIFVGMFGISSEISIIKNLIMKNIDITSSYGDINTDGGSTGGIVGHNSGYITNCGIESGEIKTILPSSIASTASSDTGGICGDHSGVGINQCYNKAKVYIENSKSTSFQVIGGICGAVFASNNKGNIVDCYNMGEVTHVSINKQTRIGSILGTIYSDKITISNCYSSYNISIKGSSSSGSASINNCYYIENDVNALIGNASKLGEAFVEDTQGLNNGYPILAWELEARK